MNGVTIKKLKKEKRERKERGWEAKKR